MTAQQAGNGGHFVDRLNAAIQRCGNALCVGLDPRWEILPSALRRKSESLAAVAGAFEEFCCRIIDIVAPLVPVVKPQCAFFEACGPVGMAVLQRTLRQARDHGLVTILDSKRNDIASTATAYADAAFDGTNWDERRETVWDADALTVNPYLGRDAIEPFLASARRSGRGLFVLVRTSNTGAGQFQDLNCEGRPLFVHVAEAVGSWARENIGQSGFGDVGAVVGATHPAELAQVRELLPDVLFLIPGFGAQGADAVQVAPGFRSNGLGAIVNSSRGIIASFKPDDPHWERTVENTTRGAIQRLRESTPMGNLPTPMGASARTFATRG